MPNTPTKRTEKTNSTSNSSNAGKSNTGASSSRSSAAGKANGASKNTATSRTSLAPTKSNGSAQKSNGMNQKSNGITAQKKSKLSADSTSQLEKFFQDQLKDIFWAEKHLTKAMPKMQKAATTDGLKSAIQEHMVQTQEQLRRLEQVFELMGKRAQAKKCEAMEGLVKEGESAIEDTKKGSMTRDVAIIMASQKIEHYEIASYGTLVQLAETMGNSEVAEILRTTLEEEKQTDQNLTSLAQNNINWEAESEEDDEEVMEEDEEDEDEEESK